MGLAPWDVFHEGFSEVVNLPFGRALVLTSFLVLFLWIPLRQPMGVGTFLNAVQIGLVADIVISLVPEQTSYWTRIPFMIVGILLVGVGSGFYIGAGLGPGPRDGLMTGLAARGMAIMKLPYQERLVGNPETGVIHGGAVTTLIDSCTDFRSRRKAMASGDFLAFLSGAILLSRFRP